MLEQIFQINQQRIFNLDQAHDLLAVIQKITFDAHLQVKKLSTQLQSFGSLQTPHCKALQAEIDSTVTRWESKVKRLGATPKGLWLVDFDNGMGYYCWKFPEERIQFWHGYQDGYTKRVLISQQEDTNSDENCGKPNQPDFR